MKKFLLFTGIGVAGYGVYRYFKHQVDLALNYEYKLEDFVVDSVEGDSVKVSVVLSLTNKSNFEVKVKEYDIDIFYKEVQFANTASDTPITILPNSSLMINASGIINAKQIRQALPVFLMDVLKKKPIDLKVSGHVKMVFLSIPSTIRFDKQNFNYSVDLLKEYNLDDDWEKLKGKYPKLAGMLGLKS